jgi:hypothetical protein
MEASIDPGVISLFGSRLRAATLGALANSRQPLTAYRVAIVTGSQVIKVITELRRLEQSGFVERSETGARGAGWSLPDPDLRDFLRRRVRLVWWDDWNEQVAFRVRRSASVPRTRVDLSRFRPEPHAVPNRREFLRRPGKDRLLAKAGLPVSRRTAARR